MSTENNSEVLNNFGSDQTSVKNLLIENGQLIETAATCQRMGRLEESLKCQETLRKNLILLAKLVEPYCGAQIIQEIGPSTAVQQQQVPTPVSTQQPSTNNSIPTQQPNESSPQNERTPSQPLINSNISPNQQQQLTQQNLNQIPQQQQQQLLQPPQQQQLYINAQQTNMPTNQQQHFSPSQRQQQQLQPNPVSPQQQQYIQQRSIPYGIVPPHVYVAQQQHSHNQQQNSLMAAPYGFSGQPNALYGGQPTPQGFNPQSSAQAQMYHHHMMQQQQQQQQNHYQPQVAPSPHSNIQQNSQTSGGFNIKDEFKFL
uniref:SS18 N-terminal domain-containing protein n=1 Tax=Meloidogyne enterolobii TaxID=390850 RepID=A0A6V7TPQ3_MELEN|nr:unnamed protein product [Meloidogyne enterolobii]